MYLFPLSSKQKGRENEDFSATASSLERNETQNPQVTPSTGGTATTAAFHEGEANVADTDFERFNLLLIPDSVGTKNPTTNPSTGGTKAHTTKVFPTQNHRRDNFITNSVMNLSDGDLEKERGYVFNTDDPTGIQNHRCPVTQSEMKFFDVAGKDDIVMKSMEQNKQMMKDFQLLAEQQNNTIRQNIIDRKRYFENAHHQQALDHKIIMESIDQH